VVPVLPHDFIDFKARLRAGIVIIQMTTWFFNASGPNVFLLIFLLFALLFVFLDNEELPTAASVFPAWWHALCMTWWPFLCCLRIHTELEKRLGTPHLIFEKVTTTSGPGVGWGRAFNVNMQVTFANVFDGQLSSAFSAFGMFSLFTVMVHCSMGKPLMLHLFTQTGVALLLAFAGAVAVIRLLQELRSEARWAGESSQDHTSVLGSHRGICCVLHLLLAHTRCLQHGHDGKQLHLPRTLCACQPAAVHPSWSFLLWMARRSW